MFRKFTLFALSFTFLFISNISYAQYVFEYLSYIPSDKFVRPESIVTIDTFLYLSAGDNTHNREPWITDGTQSGSRMLKDIFPGNYAGIGIRPYFTKYNNKIYFTASEGTNGYELWVTDGTANGTQMVIDINAGPLNSYPKNLHIFNGKLFFQANDGTNGDELWVSDGTANGTQLLKDINPGNYGCYPSKYTAFNNKLYFIAENKLNDELWVTDGTTNGTQIAPIAANGTSFTDVSTPTVFNNKLYFCATYSNPPSNGQYGLFETDGTVSGTKHIKVVVADGIAIFNNKMYFAGENSSRNTELWVSDGTTNGTQLLKDINTATNKSSDPSQFTIVGNQLFFTANDGVHGEELWVTDGTNTGTKMVKDIYFEPQLPAWGSKPNNLTSFNNKLFFTARDSTYTNRNQLWISDGTTSGTKKILEVGHKGLSNIGHDNERFAICNNNMYFVASGSSSYSLWKMTDTTKSNPPQNITDLTSNNFKIAPNPAHNSVHISFDMAIQNATISLTDISGRLIHKEKVAGSLEQTTFKLPTVSPGIYLINVTHNDGTASQRLRIE